MYERAISGLLLLVLAHIEKEKIKSDDRPPLPKKKIGIARIEKNFIINPRGTFIESHTSEKNFSIAAYILCAHWAIFQNLHRIKNLLGHELVLPLFKRPLMSMILHQLLKEIAFQS